jgi:hypothetical protein
MHASLPGPGAGSDSRPGALPPPSLGSLTCSQQCPNDAGCYHRAGGGPPLCADSASVAGCTACSSDQDCIDLPQPYCITSFTAAITNNTFPMGGCGDYDAGLCTNVSI